MEVYWIAYYTFPQEVLGVKYDKKRAEQLYLWSEVAQSCGWWWPYENVCFVCERPQSISWETGRDRPRLHNLGGPSLQYRDGWKVWSIRGMRVSEKIINREFTVAEITAEQNVEVRRVMVELYENGNKGKYLRDAGASVLATDVDKLGFPRRVLQIVQPNDESYTAVEVYNSTLEPDNTRKIYTLRIPSVAPDNNMWTPRRAVAWTFWKPQWDPPFEQFVELYDPQVET